jgi:hypothetical protein
MSFNGWPGNTFPPTIKIPDSQGEHGCASQDHSPRQNPAEKEFHARAHGSARLGAGQQGYRHASGKKPSGVGRNFYSGKPSSASANFAVKKQIAKTRRVENPC